MHEDLTEKLKILTREFLPQEGESPNDTIKRLQQIRKINKNEAVLVLNYLAGVEQHPKILLNIVKEIGRYRDLSSIKVLTDILTGFKDNKEHYVEVRSAAATTLGSIKDESAIMSLMYVMNDKEESYRVRLWAADALGKIGSSQAVSPLIKIVDDDEEKSVYLKESAAKALGMIGDDRAVESLINILETRQGVLDKFVYLKEKAIEALGKLTSKKESRLQALKNVLNDDSPHVRASAIEALSEIEDDEVTSLIEPMIYDNNESVCKTAICALYNREGKDFIMKFLGKNDLPTACREEIIEIIEEDDDDDEEEDKDEEE